ncbi:MAG TPA: ABC transporter ATP-binding protein [Desulfuromonadaceae bacterium]
MSHHIVAADRLSFTYPDGTRALREVSFSIHHGEAVAVIGANGAGKSTLLLHLNGCLAPTEGAVRVGDYPVTQGTLPEIRRTVGMIFQDPDDQLFMPTVAEDVAFGPLNLGFPPDEVAQRVDAALTAVDALHLRGKPPYRLSGGEKRRVAIATVMAMAPDILVMDEPTTGLDPFARRQLIELLARFSHTKIIATHDLELVTALCGRVIVLHEGTIAADGPTKDVFNDDALLERCRLEQPPSLRPCPLCGGKDNGPQG